MQQGAEEEEITKKCNKCREWESGATAGVGGGGLNVTRPKGEKIERVPGEKLK